MTRRESRGTGRAVGQGVKLYPGKVRSWKRFARLHTPSFPRPPSFAEGGTLARAPSHVLTPARGPLRRAAHRGPHREASRSGEPTVDTVRRDAPVLPGPVRHPSQELGQWRSDRQAPSPPKSPSYVLEALAIMERRSPCPVGKKGGGGPSPTLPLWDAEPARANQSSSSLERGQNPCFLEVVDPMRRASERSFPRVRPTLASDWAAYRGNGRRYGVPSHGNSTTGPVTSRKPAGARVCSANTLPTVPPVRADMCAVHFDYPLVPVPHSLHGVAPWRNPLPLAPIADMRPPHGSVGAPSPDPTRRRALGLPIYPSRRPRIGNPRHTSRILGRISRLSPVRRTENQHTAAGELRIRQYEPVGPGAPRGPEHRQNMPRRHLSGAGPGVPQRPIAPAPQRPQSSAPDTRTRPPAASPMMCVRGE